MTVQGKTNLVYTTPRCYKSQVLIYRLFRIIKIHLLWLHISLSEMMQYMYSHIYTKWLLTKSYIITFCEQEVINCFGYITARTRLSVDQLDAVTSFVYIIVQRQWPLNLLLCNKIATALKWLLRSITHFFNHQYLDSDIIIPYVT